MNDLQLEIIKNNLNIDISKQLNEKFNSFEQLFKIYNSHTNLVSKNDEKNLFEKHIYDSLCINLFFEKYRIKEDAKILDIGTGGGFPSLPVSIAFPNMTIYAVDSIAKKIGFIEFVQKELRLNKLVPLCIRVENLEKKERESFDVVTSRAVAALNLLLEYAIPYLKVGGYFVAYKSRKSDDEIEQAKNALDLLGAEVVEKINYNLPNDEDLVRDLIIIKKIRKTDSFYPRCASLTKKNPL